MKTSTNNKQKETISPKETTRPSVTKSLSASFYCEEGQLQLNDGKLLQALEYFQAAIDLDKENIEALNGLATTYELLGKINKAEQVKQKLNTLLKKKAASKVVNSSPVKKKKKSNTSIKNTTNKNDGHRTIIESISDKQKKSEIEDPTLITIHEILQERIDEVGKLNTLTKTKTSSESIPSPVKKKRNSSNKVITNKNDNYRTTIENSSDNQKESEKEDTTMTTVWTLVIVVFIVFIVLLIVFPDFIFGLLLFGGFIAWGLSSSK